MKIRGGCWTNIGCREMNQDAVLYRQMMQGGDYFALCAVCDGVGGLAHGEVASSFLAGKIEAWFDEVSKWVDIAQVNTDVLFSHLKDGADCWNEELCQIRQDKNMETGSTMSMLMLIRDRYYIVHVGDSRIYRYRDSLEQLTMDESVLRMKNGRMKNYLGNFMGKSESLQFKASEGLVQEGDMFLVCSDGLYHHLTEEDVSLLHWDCQKGCVMDRLCEGLVCQILERGERDNISIGLVMAENMAAGGAAETDNMGGE